MVELIFKKALYIQVLFKVELIFNKALYIQVLFKPVGTQTYGLTQEIRKLIPDSSKKGNVGYNVKDYKFKKKNTDFL